jgi:hypothetical protein
MCSLARGFWGLSGTKYARKSVGIERLVGHRHRHRGKQLCGLGGGRTPVLLGAGSGVRLVAHRSANMRKVAVGTYFELFGSRGRQFFSDYRSNRMHTSPAPLVVCLFFYFRAPHRHHHRTSKKCEYRRSEATHAASSFGNFVFLS